MFTKDSPIWLIWSRLPGAAAAAEPTTGRQEEVRCKMRTNSSGLLLHSPEGRGDFTSRKNIPGKLPTFLLALGPKVTVPSGVRAPATATRHHRLAETALCGGGRRAGVSDVRNMPPTSARI